MKKTLTLLGLFAMATAYGQGRVGINTESPEATLDIMADRTLPETYPQGVIFPKLSTATREKFVGVAEGTLIYNTDKQCIELYRGDHNDGGETGWDCVESWELR